LALGNFLYLIFGLFLLGCLLFTRPSAAALRLERTVPAGPVRPGDRLPVTRTLSTPSPAMVHDPLPDPFDIEGSNVRAAASGTHDLSYGIVASGRGEFALAAPAVFPLDPIGASEIPGIVAGAPATVLVEATGGRIARLRAPRAHGATQFAEGDRALRGPRTDEFREIREWRQGDPLKAVNWRATARASSDDNLVLLVNDYEPEGKKSVWIFLDTSEATRRGTSARTLLDSLVEGTLAAADHFLARGHRVGLATYGGNPTLVYPDHGQEQYRRLSTALTYVQPSGEADFGRAVEASRGFLNREKPLLLLFSSLASQAEAAALPRAQAYAASGRYPAPVILVHTTIDALSGPGAVIDRFASARSAAYARAFAARGARVLRWNPEEAPLAALLTMGVRR
jgi:uncharacterized protein (DUF58 family)